MSFSTISIDVIGLSVRSANALHCEELLTKDDIVDLKPYRQRLTYVQMFSQKLTELKRNLDVIEFEPGHILHFRKLALAGITKDDIRTFCNQAYDFIPNGSYFSAQSLKADGFESNLYDLGFSDWFYANLLLSDERFSYTNVFGNIVLYKGRNDITIQSFLVDRVCSYGWIDIYDLLTELSERYGCIVNEKSEVTYRLKNTQVYHDKILDRLYANAELYYRDLEEEIITPMQASKTIPMRFGWPSRKCRSTRSSATC